MGGERSCVIIETVKFTPEQCIIYLPSTKSFTTNDKYNSGEAEIGQISPPCP